jgi:Ca-activated chloride channel family protein
MKWKHYYLTLGVLVFACLTMVKTRPAPAVTGVPEVSNYGYLRTSLEGGTTAVLPLRHTAVAAQVVGVMSSVKVVQHFQNPYDRPIEAVYVFPLPHRAAVHAMTMRVGQRVIKAVIQRRDEAKATYEKAKREGKTASLLEEERPNIFTQSVANIMPGDKIEVALDYVEELVPRDGEYQFVFPMTVGPRYVGEAALRGRTGTGFAEDNARVQDASRITPHLLERGTRSGRDISVSLSINPGVNLSGLTSLTHQTTVKRPASDIALIDLDPSDRVPNRDFVVRYQLTGVEPQAALLANHDQRGGHFLLMIQPPRRPAASQLAPKEYVFVVDTSGSMDGDPLTQVKIAMQHCLAAMGPEDRFQIIRFAGNAERLAPEPLPATSENRTRGLAFVNTLAANGGTEFLPALSLALKAPRDPKRSRIVLFMSDGYIGYESEVLRFIRGNLGDANLFAFGVGSSVNRYLIDGMARIGGGEPFVLLNRVEEKQEIQRFFQMVSRPSLTGLTIDWGGLEVSDVTPSRTLDLFADKPIVLAGRFARGGGGEVTVRGFLGGKPYEQRLRVALPDQASASASPALSYLWARRRIEAWMDQYDTDENERPALEQRVTALALKYNLMSKFTSFVAVHRVERNPGGAQAQVSVPGETPEGVEKSAAPPSAFVRGALSQDQFVPGDPEVTIDAPAGTRAVTLVFPTGEVKPCTRDPQTGKWVASFLIPEGTPDGIYAIRVLIALESGMQLWRVVRYQVDGRAPRVKLSLSPGTARPGQEVELVLWPESLGEIPAVSEDDIGDPTFAARVTQEVKIVQALLPEGTIAELPRGGDGAYRLTFTAPDEPGRYPIVVVARDHARNKVREVVWLTVQK